MKTETSITKTTYPKTMAGHVKSACAARLLSLLILLALPAVVQGQFTCTTNADGLTLTITGYSGPGGDVTIPNSINGLPVTSIGDWAFAINTSLTSVNIPDSVTSIGQGAFAWCGSLTSITIPGSVTSIGDYAFGWCTSLTSVTIPGSITNMGTELFSSCSGLTNVTFANGFTSIGSLMFVCCGLTSVTIPNSVTNIGGEAFECNPLTSVTIPSSVTFIGKGAFAECSSLTNVTIPNSVTSIPPDAFAWDSSLPRITIPGSVTDIGCDAFDYCTSLTNVFFTGNAPTSDCDLFYSGTIVTVYYLSGATGWGSTFAGAPTVMLNSTPTILMPPQSQTAEIGSTVDFTSHVTGYLAMTYLWFFNGTNLISCGTNACLELTNVDSSLNGTYTVVVTNVYSAVTSSPATLNVIPAVERRPVPGVQVTGETGSALNVEYTDVLGSQGNWLPLDTVNLTNPPQLYFDVTAPLPPQRFYRAWQSGTPSVAPSLSLPYMVPAITLTGNVGDSLRLDYINAIGPTNAWVTLDTVTLTNTSQLYFDVSAPGQPRRLYRIVPVP